MPSLGADMDEGTLVQWEVAPGDTVRRGQVVAVVETAKGAIDVEIFRDGVVEELLVEPGTTVPVGQPIARLRECGEAEPTPGPAPAPATATAEPDTARVRASPAARRQAEALGIDLEALAGSGPDGAITLEDVGRAGSARESMAEAVAPAPAKPAAPGRPVDIRGAIAAAMSRAKREIPHYYLGHWVDLSPANEWLADWNASHPVAERLLPAVLMLRAVALAAARFPDFNGFWRDGKFVAGDGVHVGTAISLRRGGLVAPALKNADRHSLPELMDAFRDLVGRARAGRLTGSELLGGTITVSSLGEQGVEEVYPVIYPPQVAIVGFGTPVERPWVVGGRIEPRWLVRATLAADHRVSDGRRGALFLEAVTGLLQEPETL
nr:dihydrolipoamide acetyltransferase family protein [Thioalkalivibrio sp. XN8]